MATTILITGCSTGIGLSAAKILLARGYRVFATARKEQDVAMLRSLGLVDSFRLDINDSNSIQEGLRSVLDKTGGTLDALFNNAGYAIPGAVEDLSRDMMRQQFETNVFGAMELTNLVMPIMRKQGHGRIIQNTSILGVITIPYRGNYNASKFALEGFTNTLRQECRGTGIKVCIIAPGPIETQFRQTAYQSYADTLEQKPTAYKSQYQKMVNTFKAPANTEKWLTLPPDAVVKKLILALESPNPRAHYYVGLVANMFALLRRILPDKVLDWILVQSA